MLIFRLFTAVLTQFYKNYICNPKLTNTLEEYPNQEKQRTLYGHNGIFLDRLGPLSLSNRASFILHTLSDGCEHGSGLPSFVPKSLVIRSKSPFLSNLLHESLIGATVGLAEASSTPELNFEPGQY